MLGQEEQKEDETSEQEPLLETKLIDTTRNKI